MTTNLYMGIGRGADLKGSAITIGTSSTTTLDVELRIQTVRADASVSGVLRSDVIQALELFRKRILSDGFDGSDTTYAAGTDLPVL